MPVPFAYGEPPALRRISGRCFTIGVVISLILLLAGGDARATIVVPPEFDALVAQSDYVVRAVVKSVHAEWRERNGSKSIITKVELEVQEAIVGVPPEPLVLVLLGGKIGELVMEVDGMPIFHVGDEDILFIQGNGIQFCPVVALMHGRYPLKRDAKDGRVQVMRSNGMPLYSEKDVAKPLSRATGQEALHAVPPLDPSGFAALIRAARLNARP